MHGLDLEFRFLLPDFLQGMHDISYALSVLLVYFLLEFFSGGLDAGQARVLAALHYIPRASLIHELEFVSAKLVEVS